MADSPPLVVTNSDLRPPSSSSLTRLTTVTPQSPKRSGSTTAATPPPQSVTRFPVVSPKSPKTNTTRATPTSPSQTRSPLLAETSISTSPKAARQTVRISPGLQLRLRLLDEQTRRLLEKHWNQEDIGRIPEEQLAELEERLKEHSKDTTASARPPTTSKAWQGPPVGTMPSGGVRLSGGPVLSETEMSSSVMESDVNSSPISLGTRLVPSDSEEGCEEEGQR